MLTYLGWVSMVCDMFAPLSEAMFDSCARFADADVDVELGRDMGSAAGGLLVCASGSIVKVTFRARLTG